MKKTIRILLALALVFSLAACSGKKEDELSIGATPVPHAQLLELIKDDLSAAGITLKIVEFTDYVQPNMAVIAGDLDANFFQHIPYMETNPEWSEALVSAFGVHIEPFGLYSLRHNDIASLPNGASIAIPNDPSNGGRALLLLQANGLITLREDAGLRATPRDIVDNPRNFRFQELEAAQLPRSLEDVDAATINGNFALQAGFNPLNDSLIIEGSDSPYVNIVAVPRGNENDERIIALRNALLSDKVRDHINNNYDGGVAPVF
ncbi:MAG: MetQ/NlpA family ABC transporter substrate-binding protein [Treponema sp.]|jgi:D-methionine transport system substrate-binding protein|nr:MetQ/NlpA family ABC transporter substrate-binding protein [Treponema sp.]